MRHQLTGDAAMFDRRTYHSPLRARQADETRMAILAALERCLHRSDASEVSIELVAQEAGVERRTVFRHFDSRDAMFDAFWSWFNTRLALTLAPEGPAELAQAPREAFARFDDTDGVIRAGLHSPSGRAMRARSTPARRAAFDRALAPVLVGRPEAEQRRVTALAHLLYSAPAWEVMKDYGGLTGSEAGEAASWALALILSAVSRDDTVADAIHSGDPL
jgi:AcrR family transcriptional regulator